MILVTGGTGFLGSHLICSLLEKGYAVRAIRRPSSSLAEFMQIAEWRLGSTGMEKLQKLEWVSGDIMDYDSLLEALRGAEAAFHAAAVISFWRSTRERMYRVNVEGTANMVNACLESGVGRLCHVSSIAALGRKEGLGRIDEESPWTSSSLNSHYSKSKMLAEMEIWRGQEEGLETVIVNPGVVLGEGDWSKGSCRLFKKALEGMLFYTPGRNGYVDVIDVAEALIYLFEKKISGQRYVLVGENTDIRELFDRVASRFGRKGPRYEATSWMRNLAWRFFALKALFDGKEPLITRETARTAAHRYNYSSAKMQGLGFNFRSLDETIDRIVGNCPPIKA